MNTGVDGTDWEGLEERVAERCRELFAGADQFLQTAGVRRVDAVLKKVSLRGPRKVEDLTSLFVLADLAGRGDVLLAGADLLREVPFVGDVSNYEPVRQIVCGAVRRAGLDGGTEQPYLSLISLPERGEAGEPLRQGLIKQRAAGLLLRPPTKSDAAQATSGTHHIANVCTQVLELYLMWAFGGSFTWSRKKIDREIEGCAAILRNLRAIC